jgi:tripartite-type tricarboxylate transporter receptor subunit TctC
MKRWFFLLLTICITAAVFAGGGTEGSGSTAKTSSGFPNRPIEVIAPGHPGTGVDITLRAIAPTLEKYLGVPVVVVNDPAADGAVALNRVAKTARADGYTWCYWNIVSVATRCGMGTLKNVIDPITEYIYAGSTYIDPNLLLVRKNGPFKNLDDLVKAAKANPGGITFGRGGPTSVESVMASEIEKQRGIKFNPIDSLQGSEGIVAIMGGHLDVTGDNLSSALQAYLDDGIEILAIGGDERVAEMPNVPTFKEQGIDLPVQASERAFFGPAKIDKEIADFFRDAVKKACDDPEYKARCEQLKLRWAYRDSDTTFKNMQRLMDVFSAPL